MSINFYDVPCFVISCKGDDDRRRLTKKRLNMQKIRFQWFDAADGRNITDDEFAKEHIFVRSEDGKIHRGGSGCALSHKRIWQKIVDENIEQALVLEDDVVFHEKFKQLLPEFWNDTPHENSMVFLGYCCYWGDMGQSNVVETFPLTTHAYYMTKSVAQWFLDNFDDCNTNIDIHMQTLYYNKPRDWKCYAWWEGKNRSPYHNETKLGVCFNGLILQDHDMKNSINREIKS